MGKKLLIFYLISTLVLILTYNTDNNNTNKKVSLSGKVEAIDFTNVGKESTAYVKIKNTLVSMPYNEYDNMNIKMNESYNLNVIKFNNGLVKLDKEVD